MVRGGHRGGGRGRCGGRPIPQGRKAGPSSLQELAKGSGQSFWSKDTKLRHQAVTFVSSGMIQNEVDPSGNLTTLPNSNSETKTPPVQEMVRPSPQIPVVEPIPAPETRSPSPTPSDSSGDVVVFKGRGPSKPAAVTAPVRPTTQTQPSKSQITSPANYPVQTESSTQQAEERPSWDVGSTPWVHRSKPGVGWGKDKKAEKEAARKKAEKSARKDAKQRAQDLAEARKVEAAVLADYMENIQEHADDSDNDQIQNGPQMTLRDLSLEDGIQWSEGAAGARQAPPALRDQTTEDGWDTQMLRDLDDMSTSSDVIGEVARIISKRYRPNGVQYLVVYEDMLVDDARWLPANFLTRASEVAMIEDFERYNEEVRVDAAGVTSDSDPDTSSVSSSGDEDDDNGVFKDEDDLIERRIARMEDEEIAKIFAKQESLGMGGDDMELFDQHFAQSDIEVQYHQHQVQSSSRRARRGKRSAPTYPDASLMADVLELDPYNGFEVMDFERPSLKPKKKGRRSDFKFELSDEELEQQIKTTWEADRKKKRQQKLERAQLHAEGVIGKKKNKFKAENLAPIVSTTTWAELKVDIETFLRSSDVSYTFPPTLTKTDRVFVHEASKMFRLISESKGNAKKRTRCLTIAKGAASIDSSHGNFAQVARQVQSRFFLADSTPRYESLTRVTKGGKLAPRFGGRKDKFGGPSTHGVTYMTGEIVGSKAPEIGADNKGRALLEKMGWAQGMALGALDNKGSLDPIAHRFKAGRAGLR